MLGELFENFKRGIKSKIIEKGINPFKYCRKEFENSDLNIANLECVVSDYSNKQKPFSEFLRVPADFVYILKNNYINIVNLANNHFLDHGKYAFKQMIDVLNSNDIRTFGYSFNNFFQKQCMVIIEKNIKLGFLGYNLSNLPYSEVLDISKKINNIVAKEKEEVDLLILSLHWAYEYVNFPDCKFVDLGKNFLERGADIVYGHHSHQLQGVVNYQGKIFAPSLGNFIFDDRRKENRITGIMRITINKGLKLDFGLIPYYINRNFQPQRNDKFTVYVRSLNKIVADLMNDKLNKKKYSKKAIFHSRYGHIKNKIRIRLLFLINIKSYKGYIYKIFLKKIKTGKAY